MAEARRAFVCGHPIAHSRSPKLHGFWLKEYNIAGSYEAADVAPGEFSSFLGRLREAGFAGGNVTIPHKEAAFDLVERRDAAAQAIGAVNTLWFEGRTLVGGNTDAIGFSANLDQHAPEWRSSASALVLGAGGASRAVVHALKQAGIGDIRIANRTFERAHELADRFGKGVTAHGMNSVPALLGSCDLLVNTTSAGMKGGEGLDVDVGLLPERAIVTDIVYVPLATPLLAAAAARGLKTVDGLGMLLHQAAPGFERWFGIRPRVTDQLRNFILADLEKNP